MIRYIKKRLKLKKSLEEKIKIKNRVKRDFKDNLFPLD